jgi:hypothetical protein
MDRSTEEVFQLQDEFQLLRHEVEVLRRKCATMPISVSQSAHSQQTTAVEKEAEVFVSYYMFSIYSSLRLFFSVVPLSGSYCIPRAASTTAI